MITDREQRSALLLQRRQIEAVIMQVDTRRAMSLRQSVTQVSGSARLLESRDYDYVGSGPLFL
jgi:hypothetical protein